MLDPLFDFALNSFFPCLLLCVLPRLVFNLFMRTEREYERERERERERLTLSVWNFSPRKRERIGERGKGERARQWVGIM